MTLKGLVLEQGGTSHGAIVAREIGLPTIVNVTTRRFASKRVRSSLWTPTMDW